MSAKFSAGSKAVGATEPVTDDDGPSPDDAPILSNASVEGITAGGGTPNVTTDQATGTMYMVIVTNGDTPSNAQVIAGTDSEDAGPWEAQSQPVTVAGGQVFDPVTSLAPTTPYDVIFVHVNGAAVDSDQAKFDLMTAAGGGG